jgi:hypothetical protein
VEDDVVIESKLERIEQESGTRLDEDKKKLI